MQWTRFDAPGPPAAAGDAEKSGAANELQVRIEVSPSGRAKTATPLRVTATAGKLRVREETTLYLRKRPKGRRGGGSGSGVCAGYSPVLGGVGSIVAYPC